MTINVKIKHPYEVYDKDIVVYAFNKHNRQFTFFGRLEPTQEREFAIWDTQSIMLVEVFHDQVAPDLNVN